MGSSLRTKFVKIPTGEWDAVHEDINAHVKKRVPGETRVERVKRFAREWRNVEMELGVHKDSRGRELKYRKTYVYRYTSFTGAAFLGYIWTHPCVQLPVKTRLHRVPISFGRRTTRTAFGAGEAFRATWGALWAFLRAAIHLIT